jgi:hypothetical protein
MTARCKTLLSMQEKARKSVFSLGYQLMCLTAKLGKRDTPAPRHFGKQGFIRHI